jgi:uncharacterized protein
MKIPLFPLNTVLFPEGLLPLRIFEPRYMDMAKACLRDSTPFGVCLIQEGTEAGVAAVPEKIGTLAGIFDFDMQQLGVLQLKTRGSQRFFINHYENNGKGLLLADVTLLDAEPVREVPAEHQPCVKVLRAIIQNAGEENFPQPLRYDDATWVGYRLAEVLPLPLPIKQMTLELSDGIMRLGTLHQFMHRQGLVQAQ